MKKIIIASVILGLLLSIYSFKIYQEKKNLDNLNQWLSHQETKENLFEDDIEIMEINNLGSDIYKVIDETGDIYLVEFNQERLYMDIQVYYQRKGMSRFGFK